jgi:alpha/beta superfamily hydrolase
MPPASADTLATESVRFEAGPFPLEGELAYAEAPPRGVAVVAGPHPLLGGDMRNNVVRGLAEGLARRGVPTLRFNYRGVGGSGGPPVAVTSDLAEFWATSHVRGEQDFRDDLAAAVAFARTALGDGLPLALVGYSFGCSLLPHAGAGPGCPMALVAPTAGTHDYGAFAGVSGPLLVIAPEQDFAADGARLRGWFDGLHAPRRLVRRGEDNHFFRGDEDWLAETVSDFLKDHWEARS